MTPRGDRTNRGESDESRRCAAHQEYTSGSDGREILWHHERDDRPEHTGERAQEWRIEQGEGKDRPVDVAVDSRRGAGRLRMSIHIREHDRSNHPRERSRDIGQRGGEGVVPEQCRAAERGDDPAIGGIERRRQEHRCGDWNADTEQASKRHHSERGAELDPSWTRAPPRAHWPGPCRRMRPGSPHIQASETAHTSWSAALAISSEAYRRSVVRTRVQTRA